MAKAGKTFDQTRRYLKEESEADDVAQALNKWTPHCGIQPRKIPTLPRCLRVTYVYSSEQCRKKSKATTPRQRQASNTQYDEYPPIRSSSLTCAMTGLSHAAASSPFNCHLTTCPDHHVKTLPLRQRQCEKVLKRDPIHPGWLRKTAYLSYNFSIHQDNSHQPKCHQQVCNQ
jgi:hypothetical protein